MEANQANWHKALAAGEAAIGQQDGRRPGLEELYAMVQSAKLQSELICDRLERLERTIFRKLGDGQTSFLDDLD